jgi:nucleotide-binding universal stress UspA family protein
LWLGLKEYHVLAPTGLKVLIYADETPAGEAALTTGGRLAVAAGGPVTVLAVGDPQVTSPFLEAAGRAWLEALPRLELRARAGPAEREIVEETWEGHYELVVLGRGGDEPGGQEGIARSLLGAGVSVLLVREPPPTFRRILICTAAGEPGKSDVLFGGRVARRTGARATVLHVARPDLDGAAVERAKRHLARAVATLDALGVPAEAKVAPGGATAQILAEAQAGDYDLLVIGAPAPRSPRRLTWGEVTMDIVERSERPVLLVPMVE